jgi:5-methylthioadenosine/S-adenosylhomocysteine deaminase
MYTRLPAVAAIALAAMVVVSAQNAPREVGVVVTGGTVVTVDAAGRIIENGAVAIDGSDIAGVDTAASIGKQFRGRETIDASGQIVLPGLVNTHSHAPMVLYRGLADDLPLMEWLNNYIFPAESQTVSPISSARAQGLRRSR